MENFRTAKLVALGAASTLLLQSLSLLPIGTLSSIQAVLPVNVLSAANAKQTIRYTPPKRQRAIKTAGTGSRGCEGFSNKVTLQLLVPNNHVGQTTKARPTLMAYLAGAPEAEVSLVQRGVPQPLYVSKVKPNAQGIVKVDIPEEVAGLEAGKDYRWSVAVVCNPNRRSADVYAEAYIERVNVPETIEKQVSAATTDQVLGQAYAEAGIWYDTLEAVSQASVNPSDNPSVKTDLSDLLNQVGISNLLENASRFKRQSTDHS